MNFQTPDFIRNLFAEEVDNRLNPLLQTLADVRDSMDNMVEAVSSDVAEDIYAYWRQAGNTGAGTDVALEIQAPPGTALLITNLAYTGGVVAGVGGPLAIYIDGVTAGNLVHFIANAQIGADKGVDLYIPAGRKMIFHFYAQPNNQACTVTAVVKQLVRQAETEVKGGRP